MVDGTRVDCESAAAVLAEPAVSPGVAGLENAVKDDPRGKAEVVGAALGEGTARREFGVRLHAVVSECDSLSRGGTSGRHVTDSHIFAQRICLSGLVNGEQQLVGVLPTRERYGLARACWESRRSEDAPGGVSRDLVRLLRIEVGYCASPDSGWICDKYTLARYSSIS